MGDARDSWSDSEALARWAPRLAAALLVLFLVLQVTSVRGKSLTYDAPDHLRYGLGILHGDATRFDDSKMPVSAWNALPKRIAESLGSKGVVRDFLAKDGTARYPTMLAGLLLGALVFHWSRRLYGAAAGLLSLTLFVFDPNLLAHSRFVTTDLYAALTVALCLYAFWRFLGAASVRGRRAWGVGAALAFGVAQVAKYSGVLLVPVLLLVAGVRFARPSAEAVRTRSGLARRLRGFALWSSGFAGAAILVINLAFCFQDPFWPLADAPFRSEPFREARDRVIAVWPAAAAPVPYPYLEGLDWVLARERSGQGYGSPYLFGASRDEGGFPGYFFAVSLFKVPLPTLSVWLASLVLYCVLQVRGSRFRFARDEAFLLVPVVFYAGYFNFLVAAQIGIRHFLVVFPLLHVVSGCLLSPQVRSLVTRRGRRVAAGIGVVLGTWLAASVLSYHPHYLPYGNELLPRRRAYEIFADSNLEWGQDRELVESYRRAHPEVLWQPDRPRAGTILAGANWLAGVFSPGDTWIRGNFEPVGHLAYSHFLFEVSEEEAERARPALRGPRGRSPGTR